MHWPPPAVDHICLEKAISKPQIELLDPPDYSLLNPSAPEAKIIEIKDGETVLAPSYSETDPIAKNDARVNFTTVARSKTNNCANKIHYQLPFDTVSFSNWSRLIGAIAAFFFFIEACCKSRTSLLITLLKNISATAHFNPPMLEFAEKMLILQIQKQYPPTANISRNLKLKPTCIVEPRVGG